MFSAYCPTHDATLLFSSSAIRGIKSTPLGIELVVHCYCGEELEVLMGRPHVEDRPLQPAA